MMMRTIRVNRPWELAEKGLEKTSGKNSQKKTSTNAQYAAIDDRVECFDGLF